MLSGLGLWVMTGLSAEQHIGYLIDGEGTRRVEQYVRGAVRRTAGHPALLCYSIGNEIPASVVRWLGPHRVECYIENLVHLVKAEDPDGLVTYVNYPTSEYLDLPFLYLVSFNVYLENRGPFVEYLARLHNISGDRPLLLTEIGFDSVRNGPIA
jgi:beta-galactosidase/beta-glucuronidase